VRDGALEVELPGGDAVAAVVVERCGARKGGGAVERGGRAKEAQRLGLGRRHHIVMRPGNRIGCRQAGDGAGVVGRLGILRQRRRDLREAVGIEPVAALAEQVVAEVSIIDLDIDRHRIGEARLEELLDGRDGGLEFRRRVSDVGAEGDVEDHRGCPVVALRLLYHETRGIEGQPGIGALAHAGHEAAASRRSGTRAAHTRTLHISIACAANGRCAAAVLG